MKFYNLARMYSETTGTGTITLTTAVPGCKTFDAAGVSDSEDVSYGLITYDLTTHRPVGSEVGLGHYVASGTTLQRTTVESSTDSDDSQIDLTGLTEVYLTLPASRINDGVKFATYYYNGSEVISDSTDAQDMLLDSEWSDDYNLASLSSNVVTIAKKGWYQFLLNVYFQSNTGDPLNGRVFVNWSAWNKAGSYATASGVTIDNFYLTGLLDADTDNFVCQRPAITNRSGVAILAWIYEFTLYKVGDK